MASNSGHSSRRWLAPTPVSAQEFRDFLASEVAPDKAFSALLGRKVYAVGKSILAIDPDGVGGTRWKRVEFLKYVRWLRSRRPEFDPLKLLRGDAKFLTLVKCRISELASVASAPWWDGLRVSFESLSLVTRAVRRSPRDSRDPEFYAQLVAFVGEVVRRVHGGSWRLVVMGSGGRQWVVELPSRRDDRKMISPLTVVLESLGEFDNRPIDLDIGVELAVEKATDLRRSKRQPSPLKVVSVKT